VVTVGVPGWLEGGLGMASRTINIPATTNLDADELTSGTVPFARLSVGTRLRVTCVGRSSTSPADAVAAASARVAVLPSDVSAVSTTTLTDVSGLAVALEASSRYLVHVRGVCGGDVSADLSVALAGPAGASAVGVTLLAPTTAAANSPFTASTGTGVVTPGLGTALTVGVAGTASGTKRRVHFELSAVVTTTTAGDLRVQMAQAVSTATEVTIFAGSVLRAEKVV